LTSPSVTDHHWLEISMTVDGELAEAVAEVLARFAPDGVAIESTAVVADEEDEGGRAVGPLRVCCYLPADTNIEETRQKIEQALWYLGRISPMPAPQFKLIQEVNWVETWKQHYHPIAVGRRLMVLPAWIEDYPADRIPIRIEPGMAFGTGTHPTTQLCMALAESQALQGQPVIDVGCGSGILCVAALKLGASKALGIDIDPEAIGASQQNAAINGVSERLEVGVGSVSDVRLGKFSIRQAPLVFANILAPIIVRLLKDGLAELVAPGGSLILSGILAEQEETVLEAARAHGLRLCEDRQVADWVAVRLSPEPN
jgi:ribosomal protein L11 methyltransferase